MMGLANWIHWCAWFTKNLLFLLVSIGIATILLKVTDTEFENFHIPPTVYAFEHSLGPIWLGMCDK